MHSEKHIDYLDGFRGFAALWVLLCHSLILSGSSLPILKRGDAAVNLFMVMSGFLMTFHAFERRSKEPWESSSTWFKFYIRRFFRVAPMYYLMLLIALSFGAGLYHCREVIAQHYPLTAQSNIRYEHLSGANILTHIMFIFGFFPAYANQTPLPDWSIGLEMQFYLFFPLLMLCIRGKNYFWFTFLLCAGGYLLSKFVIKDAFSEPGFLPLRIQFFVIGILLAIAHFHRETDRKTTLFLIVLSLIVSLTVYDKLTIPMTIFIATILFYSDKDVLRIKPAVSFFRQMLSCRVAKMMADLSYSVYLIHLIVMAPIGAMLFHVSKYAALPGIARFLVLSTLTAAASYSLAYFSYKFIEQRGIALGKSLIANSPLQNKP